MSKALALTPDGGLTWAKPKGRARGQHKPGEMNGTESAYSSILEARKIAGEIQWYWFEAFTFKIGKDCRYTPDFVVMLPDGLLECHEVKGGWIADDSTVKIRAASAIFPFRFVQAQKQTKKNGGAFEFKEF
jgi:hypothetical protein